MSASDVTALLSRARRAVEAGEGDAAAVAWDEAERLAGLVDVPVRERLRLARCHEDALSWSLWGAARGNTSAMFSAACCYRDGVGTRRDRVQAVRWFLMMQTVGDGDGVHEAIGVVKSGMTDAQILGAGRLAGDETAARGLIFTVRPQRRRSLRARLPWWRA